MGNSCVGCYRSSVKKVASQDNNKKYVVQTVVVEEKETASSTDDNASNDSTSTQESTFGVMIFGKRNQVVPIQHDEQRSLSSEQSTKRILQTGSLNSLIKMQPVKSKSQRFAMLYPDNSLRLAVYCSQFLMSNLEQKLLEQKGKESIEFTPRMYYRDSVVLFVDISGFTSLTESLSKHEHGAEVMTKYVNGYFSLLVDVVTGHGGDVEKWSGDAMICVWYDQKQSLLELLQRTIHCGLDVQQQYGTFQAGNVLLTLHCAIAAGTLITFDMAGYNDRWLRYTFGSPFSELNTAVDESGAGQLIISKNTFEKYKLSNFVDASRATLGNYLVEELKVSVPKKAIPLIYFKSSLEPLMRRFVDPHVQNKIDADQARYLSEMKYATIGFISMHDRTEYATEEERLRDYSLTMKHAQEIIHSLEGDRKLPAR